MATSVRLEACRGDFSKTTRDSWEASYDLLRKTLEAAEITGKFVLKPECQSDIVPNTRERFIVMSHDGATPNIELIINPELKFGAGLIPVWRYILVCPIQRVSRVLTLLEPEDEEDEEKTAVAVALEGIGNNVKVLEEAAGRLSKRKDQIAALDQKLGDLEKKRSVIEENIGRVTKLRDDLHKENLSDSEAQEASRALVTLNKFIGGNGSG